MMSLPEEAFYLPFEDQQFLSSPAIAALRRFLPANDESDPSDLPDPPVDAYSCDDFRIYEFKVRRCARGRSHDWTECPYAHPGEKARRRDPRKFHYSGVACPDFRKGACRRGDFCEFAHGVFECWLHPARYRTQPCKDGTACRRRVCFFAHTQEQLRVVLPGGARAAIESYDGSPMRLLGRGVMSPPMSPTVGSPVNEVLMSLRKLQLSKVKSLPCERRDGGAGSGFGGAKSGFYSLPATPVGAGGGGEEGERVESGRGIRAKMYERFSRESGLGQEGGPGQDVGWVSELVN